MLYSELSKTEIDRRKALTENIRRIITSEMVIHHTDRDYMLTTYREFFLQISFSEVHPLMVFSLARPLRKDDPSMIDLCNEMNMNSVLGSHAINEAAICYHYRATHWLETELTRDRFFEILDRCVDEAEKGYCRLTDW